MLIVYLKSNLEVVSFCGFIEEVSTEMIDSIDTETTEGQGKIRIYDYSEISRIFSVINAGKKIKIVNEGGSLSVIENTEVE